MSDRLIELAPINEIVAKVREEALAQAKATYERMLADAEESVKKIEQNRQAAALLDAAGIDLYLPSHLRGGSIHIDLGFFPASKAGNRQLAEKVRLIRDALGCRLEVYDKDVADAKRKRVQITLKPVDFPGIRIRYKRKLPAGAKCRIVHRKSSYSSLVCEV